MAIAKNLFVNRSTGIVVRVGPVDDGYALIQSMSGPPMRYSMPIAEYDGGAFVRAFRPATEDDLAAEEVPDFRMPGDAPADWLGVPKKRRQRASAASS